MSGFEENVAAIKDQIEKAKSEVNRKEREHLFWQLIGHLLDTQEVLLSKLRDRDDERADNP